MIKIKTLKITWFVKIGEDDWRSEWSRTLESIPSNKVFHVTLEKKTYFP